MGEQPKPQVGQIWKEADPRFTRHVRVMQTCEDGVYIRTVLFSDKGFILAKKSRLSFCDPSRFNGKRGGYEFVAEAA